MKRILLPFLTVWFTLPTLSHAQDIFNMYLDDAIKIMNDSSAKQSLARIATFKYNALQYTRRKAFEAHDEVSRKFLDDQAYFMNDFLNLFFASALLNNQLSKSEKKARILAFIDASANCPLYDDPDTDITHAYIQHSDGQLTPFSLNTNWPLACKTIRTLLDMQKK